MMMKRSSSSLAIGGEEEREEELGLNLVVVSEDGIVEEISPVRGPLGSLWACCPCIVTSSMRRHAWMENIVARAALIEQRLAYNQARPKKKKLASTSPPLL